MTSVLKVTEPTAIVGKPVSFFVQPANVRSLPRNAGSQNLRVEACRPSTPAATNGDQKAVEFGGCLRQLGVVVL